MTTTLEIAVVFTLTMSAVAVAVAVAGIWLASLVLVGFVGCGWLAAEAEVIINNIVVIVIASHDEMRFLVC